MSRTGRFIGGLLFGYMNQALVTLVGLWLTAFLLTRLGQQQYGLWLIGTRILGYLMLLDLGVIALLPRETAFATGRAGGPTQARDLPEIVGRTARLVLWQLPVVALAAILVWIALPGEWEPLRNPLAVVLAVFVIGFPLRMFEALLNGLQELSYLGTVFTATWVVGTAITVGLVLTGWGLYALAVGWGTGRVLAHLLWWLRIRQRYPEVIPSRLASFTKQVLRDRLCRGAWISLSELSHVLLQGTDLLIIGTILGSQAVVPYFCTAKVLTVLGLQPQMLAQTAQPALSELRTSPDRHRIPDVCVALTRAILMLSGAIVCIVLVVNEGFVSWWVGDELYEGFTLTAVLLAAMLLRHWNTAVIYSLFSFGRDRRVALTHLSDGVVTVALSVALLTHFGLVGVAAASVLGALLVGLPANVSGLAREMQVSVTHLVAGVWPWVWRFCIVCSLSATVAQAWVPQTIPALMITTVVVGGLYTALMLPLALRDPLGMYVRPRLDTIRRIVLREGAVPLGSE